MFDSEMCNSDLFVSANESSGFSWQMRIGCKMPTLCIRLKALSAADPPNLPLLVSSRGVCIELSQSHREADSWDSGRPLCIRADCSRHVSHTMAIIFKTPCLIRNRRHPVICTRFRGTA